MHAQSNLANQGNADIHFKRQELKKTRYDCELGQLNVNITTQSLQ